MADQGAKFSPKNALGVIALFVGVVELAFAYPVTVLPGGARTALVVFMLAFPVIVLAGFFFVLIRYPENFYSPADFADPKAFMMLVTRRDKATNEHLRVRTDALLELASAAQSRMSECGTSLSQIAAKIEVLPELDRAELDRSLKRTEAALNQSTRLLESQTASVMASFCHHACLGIDEVWIDTASLGEANWSLDFLQSAALAAMRATHPHNDEKGATDGSVEMEDGDYVCIFKFTVKPARRDDRVNLILELERRYCTMA